MSDKRGESVPKTISLPKQLFEAAEERRKNMQLVDFSKYVRMLIQDDLKTRREYTIREQPSGSGEEQSSRSKRTK